MAKKTASSSPYAKTLTPNKSDPKVFSDLMHKLGVSSDLTFTDIWSMEDASPLEFVQWPVLALILILPTKDEEYDDPPGLVALLHATINANTRRFIVPDSLLDELISKPPTLRSVILGQSPELEITYQEAALRGSTAVPALDEEVDLHYVCFIKSRNGTVHEVDGDAAGPIDTDVQLNERDDLLEASVRECIRKRIAKADAEGSFNLLALTKTVI